MIKHSIRCLTTTAHRAANIASKADMGNQYGVHVAKAQGHVNGLVGGSVLLVSLVLAPQL